MRIAQVSPWFYPHLGGVESHVMSLSRELASRGHEVTVITTRDDPLAPESETIDGVRVVRVRPRTVVLRTPVAPRIRAAVQELFNVTVLDVRTIRMPRKTRRVGKFIGRKPEWKKAIVELAEGQSIEFFEGV